MTTLDPEPNEASQEHSTMMKAQDGPTAAAQASSSTATAEATTEKNKKEATSEETSEEATKGLLEPTTDPNKTTEETEEESKPEEEEESKPEEEEANEDGDPTDPAARKAAEEAPVADEEDVKKDKKFASNDEVAEKVLAAAFRVSGLSNNQHPDHPKFVDPLDNDLDPNLDRCYNCSEQKVHKGKELETEEGKGKHCLMQCHANNKWTREMTIGCHNWFHPGCVGLEDSPCGDWVCYDCVMEKFIVGKDDIIDKSGMAFPAPGDPDYEEETNAALVRSDCDEDSDSDVVHVGKEQEEDVVESKTKPAPATTRNQPAHKTTHKEPAKETVPARKQPARKATGKRKQRARKTTVRRKRLTDIRCPQTKKKKARTTSDDSDFSDHFFSDDEEEQPARKTTGKRKQPARKTSVRPDISYPQTKKKKARTTDDSDFSDNTDSDKEEKEKQPPTCEKDFTGIRTLIQASIAAEKDERIKVLQLGHKDNKFNWDTNEPSSKTRLANSQPCSGTQCMDDKVRKKMNSLRRTVEQLQCMTAPSTYRDDCNGGNKKQERTEEKWHRNVHGLFCATQQAPNIAGNGHAQALEDDTIYFWSGSHENSKWLKEKLQNDNTQICIVNAYNGYETFFIEAKQKTGKTGPRKKKEDAEGAGKKGGKKQL